jgi:hypothetical protein
MDHKDVIINSQMIIIENLLKEIRNRNDAIEYSIQRINELSKYEKEYYRSVEQLKKCLKVMEEHK